MSIRLRALMDDELSVTCVDGDHRPLEVQSGAGADAILAIFSPLSLPFMFFLVPPTFMVSLLPSGSLCSAPGFCSSPLLSASFFSSPPPSASFFSSLLLSFVLFSPPFCSPPCLQTRIKGIQAP
eukprot:m.67126 g.67126  ORF g.67126 m.67126 type:complete len:124 (-) comp13622_c1_seq4:328-699(-)